MGKYIYGWGDIPKPKNGKMLKEVKTTKD